MGQVSSHTAPKEQAITGQITERRPRQVQIASSIPPTTGHDKRLGMAFHGGVLFDSSSESFWSSNVQSSTRSSMRILLETEPNKIRDRTHTPAGGIDEELDIARLTWRYSCSLRSRRAYLRSATRAPRANLSFLRARGPTMVRRGAETGLDRGHARVPTLASSCAWRLVVVG